MIRELWQAVTQRTEIPLTERDLERALGALLASGDLWEVIAASEVPMMALCPLLELLQERGLLEITDGHLHLTSAGEEVAQEAGIAPPPRLRCPRCGGRGLDLESPELARLLQEFRELVRERPGAVQQFDQGYVTPETAVARVAALWANGDLEGKRIIVLGDDDLTGLALALTGKAKRILTIDIDKRILEFTARIAQERGLEIETAQQDLRRPLPKDWLKNFDTFITDPPESKAGLEGFLKRGLQCLAGPGSAGYFGLTRLEASLHKWHEVQRFLLDQGAVITALIPRFNEYENWEYLERMRSWEHLPVKRPPAGIWYRSALYRLELLRSPALPNDPLPENLFDDAEAATN